MAVENGRITIAIQKTGRLSDETFALLEKCDINIPREPRQDWAYSSNFPLKVLYLRNGDIPSVVQRGNADLGFVGSDKVVESGYPLREVLGLDTCKSSLVFAVPEGSLLTSARKFNRRSVATSFPNLTKRFFSFYGAAVEILKLDGSVELAGNQGWVDGVVDLSSSGDSMKANNLSIQERLMDCEAEIVAGPTLSRRPDTVDIIKDLFTRILSNQRIKKNRYIAIDAKAGDSSTIALLAPGAESATITNCSDPGVVAIQTLVGTRGFWETTRKIQDAGGREIVELAVVRSIPNIDDPELLGVMRKIYASREMSL